MISSTTIFKLVVAASLATALGAALATLSAQRAEAAASGSPQDSRTTAADADRTVFHRTIKIDGLDIFYREAGPADAPTILPLHGLPTDSTTKGDSMTDTDRREIQTVLDRYEKALNASNVDAVLELYADDVPRDPAPGICRPGRAGTSHATVALGELCNLQYPSAEPFCR